MRERIDTYATKALVVIVAIVVPVMLILQAGLTIRLQKGVNSYLPLDINIVSYNNTTFSTTINYYNTTDYNSVSQENNHTVAPPATDAAGPKIIEMHALPPIQLVGNNVTIICKVIDDFTIECVKVNITGPSGFTRINITMGKSANTYYYKDTYSILGNYSYYIWANDSNNNAVCSAVNQFQIVNISNNSAIEIIRRASCVWTASHNKDTRTHECPHAYYFAILKMMSEHKNT